MPQTDKSRAFLARHGMEPERVDLGAAAAGFLAEMERGLAGRESSLRMLPTYLDVSGALPLGRPAAVIDAGGTNFRTALVTFTANGPAIERLALCPMPGTAGPVAWEAFIRFAAARVAPLLAEADCLGFCFSYPTEETPARDGHMLRLTKQVRLEGFEGRLICADLAAELARMGISGKRLVLLNDTPAVLLSGAGRPEPCDGLFGLIAGTGTNTCCALPVSAIPKLGGGFSGRMLVNLESGAYLGLPRGDFDEALDAATADPGVYWHEKMTSGAYLGELCRLVLRGAGVEGLFSPAGCEAAAALARLSAAEADALAAGASPGPFGATDAALAGALCLAVFERAARCVCANLAAMLRLADAGRDPARPARICADGSVIRRSRSFAPALARCMRDFTAGALGRHAVFYSTENATIVGTAAAALLNS